MPDTLADLWPVNDNLCNPQNTETFLVVLTRKVPRIYGLITINLPIICCSLMLWIPKGQGMEGHCASGP